MNPVPRTPIYAARYDDPLACLAISILSNAGPSTMQLTMDDAYGSNIVPIFTCDGQYHASTRFARLVTPDDIALRKLTIPPFALEAQQKIALVNWPHDHIQGKLYDGFRASLLHLHARLTNVQLLKAPPRTREKSVQPFRRTRSGLTERPWAL